MKLVFILLLDEVTDFFKLDKGVIRVVDNQEIHDFDDVVVQVLHLGFVLGISQQLLEPVVFLDKVTRNENRVGFSVH